MAALSVLIQIIIIYFNSGLAEVARFNPLNKYLFSLTPVMPEAFMYHNEAVWKVLLTIAIEVEDKW